MYEQTPRRLFIAFLALIVGAALAGGLVILCARPASSGEAKAASAGPAVSVATSLSFTD